MLTWKLTWQGKNGVAMWRCMNTPRGARVCVQVCAHVCECVSVCLCAHVQECNYRDKASFLGKRYLSKSLIRYIHVKSPWFWSCGTIFMFLCVQLMWCHVEHLIVRFNHDCRSSLKWKGTWCTLVCRWIILKQFNLSHSSEELQLLWLKSMKCIKSVRSRSNGCRFTHDMAKSWRSIFDPADAI